MISTWRRTALARNKPTLKSKSESNPLQRHSHPLSVFCLFFLLSHNNIHTPSSSSLHGLTQRLNHTKKNNMCSAEKDGIMLFGVRLSVVDNHPTSFRKSASMTNLSQYESPPPHDPNAGYASDDVVHPSRHTRERKRGMNRILLINWLINWLNFLLRCW